MRLIYACYQTYLCLLSNVAMLAVKCSYACCQTYLCLLSNVSMLAIKYAFYCREINSQRVSTLVSIGALQLLTNVPIC